MNLYRYCFPLLATLLLFSTALDAIARDSSELKATYGRGVHAYFAGQLYEAEQLFTQVISAGSKDPRVFYFRATTLMRLGRQFEAENDMQTGASYEAQNPGSQYAIGRALQRVQGHHRRTLEKFRRRARLDRVRIIRNQNHNRYEQLQKRSGVVLHQETPVRLETLVDPNVAVQPGGPALPVAKPAPTVPEPTPTTSEDDFFESDPGEQPAPADASDALFDEEPAAAEETPAAGDSFDFDEPAPANEEAPAEEAEEVDDFFGAAPDDSPVEVAADAEEFAAAPSTPVAAMPNSPAAGLFFQLGQWMGEATNADYSTSAAAQPAADFEVSPAGFELGPDESEETEESSFEDSSIPEEETSDEAAADEEQDPFADEFDFE